MSEEMYKSMFQDTIRALAAIDTTLGMPEDGCNSPERTITAIKLLHSAHADDVATVERLEAEVERLRGVLRGLDDEDRLVCNSASEERPPGPAPIVTHGEHSGRPVNPPAPAPLYPGCRDNDTGYHRPNMDGECSDCGERLADKSGAAP